MNDKANTVNTPNTAIENTSLINNNIIRPKYLKNKSIVYKSSNYVRDLLGEGK